MKQIDALWKLQEIENTIEQKNKDLKEMADTKIVDEKVKVHQQLKRNLREKILKAEKLKKDLCILERKLGEMIHKHKEVKEKLYGGKINDLKQLGNLLQEQEKLENNINKINGEVIDKMEHLEILDISLKEMEVEDHKLEQNIKRMLRQRKRKGIENQKLINELKMEKEKVQRQINEKNLEIYHYIKSKKKNPVASVKKGICIGCHMYLPVTILTQLKKQEIVTCSNCGRILYNDIEE